MKTDLVPKFVTIDAEQVGRRLDNFLVGRFSRVPKSLFYRLIRGGQIRVNKKRVKVDYRLQLDDQIRFPFIDMNTQEVVSVSSQLAERLNKAILFEDEGLIVIDKPAGIPVHGGSGVSIGLIEALRQMRGEQHYLELVHRLDKETSGCLMIAKKPSILRQLHEQLREGKIKKTYLTLTKGHWPKEVNRVDLPLEKNRLASGERRSKSTESGKSSVSIFRVIKRFSMCDLVEVDLLTGRMHQIRAHAQLMGHPVAGDTKYGDRAFNQFLSKEQGVKRLFLHAETLAFCLQNDQKETIIKSTRPDSLSRVINNLNKEEQ